MEVPSGTPSSQSYELGHAGKSSNFEENTVELGHGNDNGELKGATAVDQQDMLYVSNSIASYGVQDLC